MYTCKRSIFIKEIYVSTFFFQLKDASLHKTVYLKVTRFFIRWPKSDCPRLILGFNLICLVLGGVLGTEFCLLTGFTVITDCWSGLKNCRAASGSGDARDGGGGGCSGNDIANIRFLSSKYMSKSCSSLLSISST